MEPVVLLSALPLELTEEGKLHAHRASVGSKAKQALGEVFFSDGRHEPVEQKPGKYFARDLV